MLEGRLVFNNNNGQYGIKLSNTDIWVTEGLSDGDRICVFDYMSGYFVDEEIRSKSPGNSPVDWNLKVIGLQGTELQNLSVQLDE